MSNYKYLREIIEKIAERGRVPKGKRANVMREARNSSNHLQMVDNYVNNRLPEAVRNQQTLEDFIADYDQEIAESMHYDSDLPPFAYVPRSNHNKYNKYIPIRRRIKERQDVLNRLLYENFDNEEKTKLYEALLERLENHPLYNERNY